MVRDSSWTSLQARNVRGASTVPTKPATIPSISQLKPRTPSPLQRQISRPHSVLDISSTSSWWPDPSCADLRSRLCVGEVQISEAGGAYAKDLHLKEGTGLSFVGLREIEFAAQLLMILNSAHALGFCMMGCATYL